MYAYFQDSEDGWYSVIKYFQDKQPPERLDALYVEWAKERLAEFYLHRRQWLSAKKIYEEFAQQPLISKQRAISDYGLAICEFHLDSPVRFRELRSAPLPELLTKVLRDQWQAIIDELEED
jgi:hypothetical protein